MVVKGNREKEKIYSYNNSWIRYSCKVALDFFKVKESSKNVKNTN